MCNESLVMKITFSFCSHSQRNTLVSKNRTCWCDRLLAMISPKTQCNTMREWNIDGRFRKMTIFLQSNWNHVLILGICFQSLVSVLTWSSAADETEAIRKEADLLWLSSNSGTKNSFCHQNQNTASLTDSTTTTGPVCSCDLLYQNR